MNIVEIGALGIFAGPVMGIVTSIVTSHRTKGGANIGAGTRNTAKVGIILQIGAGVFFFVMLFAYLFDSYSSMDMVLLYPLAILPISLWHAYFTF